MDTPADSSDDRPAETPRLGLRFAALSDVGRVRKDNQDSGFASEHLLVIADGVGGAARGDVASSTAVQALRRLDGPAPEDMLEALAGAIHRAHDRIAELVEQEPELDGTSTTVTAALFDGTRVGLAHVGDSRGYLLRDGTLSQLTKDHTFVQSLIDEGRITEEESRTHPHRNLILRAVDGVHETDPDLFYIELAPGDRLLLCSDGASGVLDHDRLADILGTGSIDYAVVELIRASLEAGSSDNITCVVADVVDPAVTDDGPPLAAASTGPMVVGAAAEQPRRAGQGSKSFFRGHRGGDTGEIDPVPGEPGDASAVDPEELRYAPQEPRRRRWVVSGIVLLVLALVAAVVGVVAYRWSQRQYYVAAHASKVAIYRGVQATIPGREPQQGRRGHPGDDRVPAGLPGRTGPLRHLRHVPGRRPADRRAARRRGPGVPDADADAHAEPQPDPQAGRLREAQPHRDADPEPVPEPVPDARAPRLRGGHPVSAMQALRDAAFTHRRRRGAELFLLVISLVVGIGAYAAVGLGVEDSVPADIVGYGGWLAVLCLGCHVVVRLVAPYADPVLLPVVAALNGLGLAMIHRIDLADLAANPDAKTFARGQLIWMTLGVVLFVLVLVVVRDHRRLQSLTYTSGFVALVLLLMPLLPVLGTTINGSRIWIRLGPFSFQPGEIAKVMLVLFFAGYLVLHRDALALAGRRFAGIDLPRGRDLGPILVMWLISLGVLVFQRDLGSSLLFFGLFLVMLYVATERPGWLVVGSVMFVSGAYVGYLAFGHVQSRVNAWLHPFDPAYADSSYQIVQGMYGMAWGGLIGRGFGQGDPTLIPFSYSDFIFASIGEELGLTGVFAVLLLYGIIVERALRTALVCRDAFGKLIAVGLAVVFALQVFVVVGGVTKLIPLTGLTTPFMSYGGSSLVANWAIIALLLRISDQARRPLPDLTSPEEDDATQVVNLR